VAKLAVGAVIAVAFSFALPRAQNEFLLCLGKLNNFLAIAFSIFWPLCSRDEEAVPSISTCASRPLSLVVLSLATSLSELDWHSMIDSCKGRSLLSRFAGRMHPLLPRGAARRLACLFENLFANGF